MSDLFRGLAAHTGATVALTFVFFVLMGWLLTRNRFGEFLSALVRVFMSVFIAPILYLVTSVRDLADEVGGAEGPTGNRQYLMQQLHLTLSALIMVAALVVLSGSIAVGWVAMVPDQAFVRAYSDLKAQRAEMRARVEDLRGRGTDPAVLWASASAPSTWSEETQRLWRLGRASEDSAKAIAVRFQQATSKRLPEDVFGGLAGLIDATALNEFSDAVSRDVGWALSSGQAAYGAQELGWIQAWTQHWVGYRIWYNQFGSEVNSDLQDAQAHLAALDEQLPGAEELTEWKQLRFVVATAMGVLRVIVLLWVFGLLLEGIWLGVDMATNIRSIARGSVETSTRSAKPTPDAGA